MPLANRFSGLFGGLIDRTLCVLGAIAFSQAPEFMQQYLQRLGGHLDEAKRQLDSFRASAAQSGVSFENLIQRTTENHDAVVAQLGTVMTQSIERARSLQAAHDALLGAASWERPFVFLRYLDSAIADATWAVFKPAVPTTLEGLAYATAGMICALAAYHLALSPASRLCRRIFRQQPQGEKAGANGVKSVDQHQSTEAKS